MATKQKPEDPVTTPRDNTFAESDRVIVIGASAGGFEALRTIIHHLPSDFSSPIFIVWHLSPDGNGVLPHVLNRENSIYAAHAYDDEEIKSHRIYIAPPDHHMLIQDGRIRITRGPKENRFRPAVDPLFRSAAYSYGNRVIGIILSGALDDGSAGLWTVKHYGGIAIVQDPFDAEVPAMPVNAGKAVKVHYTAGADQMSELLVRLSREPLPDKIDVMKDEQTKKEIEVAAEGNPLKDGAFKFGQLTPFTCPECHGVLSRLQNDNIVRFRCHTGHAYSVDTLLAALTERIEDSLYSAIRGIDESIMLLNHLGDHYAEDNQPTVAAIYFKKAKEAEARNSKIRNVVQNHEQLSKEALYSKAADGEDD